jgi:hypothetical protein
LGVVRKKLSFHWNLAGWWLGGSKFPSRVGLLDVVGGKQFHPQKA